ncbi:MAG: protoporphyrinogen/coproporphyrinogen oxidase, partial [Acidimicrobiales bacterium]
QAARAGHRVSVLERAARPGGMAASFEVAGVRVDHGSHRLHPTTDPAILAELQRLLGGQLQWRRRRGRIRLAGRWIGFPLRLGDLARHLPPSLVAAALADAVAAPLRRPRDDTFAEVVRAGPGPTALAVVYGPYASKLWGLDATALSGEQARRRISVASPGAVVARLLGGGRARRRSPPGFWYPARGFGSIVEALAAAATEAGVELRHRLEVAAVALGGPGRGARVAMAGGGAVEAAHVWSTLPLTALAEVVVDPPPPPEVTAAARCLAFRALVLVYLVLDLPRWTPYDAHYLPGPETPVSRVSEPKNYRDGPDDPPDRTVVCAELPCTVGDGVWAADDHELGAVVVAGLAAQDLPPLRPVAVVSRRLPAAYPVYARGFEDAFGALDAWASSLPGLVTLGRGGLFAHDNTHHALAMGWAAAEALDPAGRWDPSSWAAARDRFAHHVVED